MKKALIVISALMLSAPAFAKTTIITFKKGSSPLAALTKSTARRSTNGSSTVPFGESYTLTGPGFGKGSTKTYSKSLPKLGTFDVNFDNGGKGNSLSFTESISH